MSLKRFPLLRTVLKQEIISIIGKHSWGRQIIPFLSSVLWIWKGLALQVNLATFVLSLRPAMESWGLVWFYFLNRVQIPLYCVTTSEEPHPNLPSRIAPGCFSAGNPNPNPSLEGGRPPVHLVNSCWAPALPGCDFSGMQGRLWSENQCCLCFPIELGHPHVCHGLRTQL